MKKALVFTLLAIVGAALGPDSPAADRVAEAARYSDLGFAALETGRSAKARKLFTRALKMVPSFPNAHRGLGDLAMEQGRFSDAVAEYRAERTGYPSAAALPNTVHFRVGLALIKAELWDEAVAAYERGLAADPDWAKWAVLAPLAMNAMFLFVSIPLLEKRSLQRRPNYQQVIDETSMLIPLPPRRAAATGQSR